MKDRRLLIKRTVEALLAAMLLGMCVLTFGNVVLRYGFNSGIASSDEIARLLLVWLTFIGAVLAMYEGTHIGVDMLVRRVPIPMQKIFFFLSNALVLLCCVILFKGSWSQVMINLTIKAPVTGYSMGLLYASGLFAATGMGLAVLRNLWRLASGRITSEELLQVADSEEEFPVEAVPANAKHRSAT
jgi:TRAP-type C4-dicarboxylate transport system permease small subunit